MSITDEMRKAFDDCTVIAGADNEFECVYITKSAAIALLDKIDEAFEAGHERAMEYGRRIVANQVLEIAEEMRELGASTMTPQQLFCLFAGRLEKMVAKWPR